MIIKLIIILLVYMSILGFCYYIHLNRMQNKYIDSYKWFTRILK
jgi:Tfp pilus assembly protein PilO